MAEQKPVTVLRHSLARRTNERPHDVTTIYVKQRPAEHEVVQVSVSWSGKVRVFWNDAEVQRPEVLS